MLRRAGSARLHQARLRVPVVDAEALIGLKLPVPDQASLRPAEAARDLDEFLEFLTSLEAVFGADRRPRPPTIGERFLL